MENERKYYIYAYLDISKKVEKTYSNLGLSFLYEPFYIGKGKGDRYISHFKGHRLKSKTYISNKINHLISIDKKPTVVKLYENLTEEEAFELERHLISTIGRHNDKKGPLVNITDGGEGVSGLKHTEESRSKMSLKGEKHPNFGKNLQESTKEKISEKLKLNNPMKNPKTSEKVRLKNLGRTPWNKGLSTPEDVCKKQSEKKIKYRNIKMVSKENPNEIETFENIYDAMAYTKKCYRSIYLYIQKGESLTHYWIIP